MNNKRISSSPSVLILLATFHSLTCLPSLSTHPPPHFFL